MKYFLTEKGKTCSDHIAIGDSKTCREAAEELHLDFKGTKNVADWPKGCYGNTLIYFNQHSTGSYKASERKICEVMGKISKL